VWLVSTHIPSAILDVQRAASDPAVSAWVAANAGSGKTHVLAQRVIRLLLRGTQPERILCLTYTKAAAANMANRVFETLSKWTAFDDKKLDGEIAKIEGRRPDTRRRLHARRLFAQALDTPGGLKVQTIHAFCTRLLHQFPFEADVAARFEVLEERAQSELIDRLRMAVLLQAAAKPESDLGRALAIAITAAADQTFNEMIIEAIARRDELIAWIASAGGIAAAIKGLSQSLGIAMDDSIERIEADIVNGPHFPMSEWAGAAALCRAGSNNDQKQCERLTEAAAASGATRIDKYLDVFFTQKFELRGSILTSSFAKTNPDLARRLDGEKARAGDVLHRRRAVETRERTAALVTIAAEVIARYGAEKERRGLLDYEGLIDKTLHLLTEERAQWVHYKLDLGIDHVLIDEAQDTSPKQWEIVKRLTAEFTAGKGAREVTRSIFAVGDEKQSIFSFQGAMPAQFEQNKRHYAAAFATADMRFTDLKFRYSFRSAPLVLDAVDVVFERPEAFAGLTEVPGATVHEAVRANAPGTVELWPMIEPDERIKLEGWDAPFDESSEKSPRVRLAQKIARTVTTWLGRGDFVGDGERRHAAGAGDILVLVRQRGALFNAIIYELKRENIAVAGADRLTLTEHIAVMDLMTLADALLLPGDDLALASALKSPLFGVTEEQLFTLAHGRKGTLRAALHEKAADLEFMAVNAQLERYAAWAAEAPFSFYSRVLGAEGGRARFYARLGPEAADALDEFLEHALIYERHEAPTLQGFIAWLRAGETQVKRDMDIARDEVRVMTVHGAKGLEAPIVILADTTTPPKGPKEPRLLALPVENAVPGTPSRLIWAGRKADDIAPVAAARANAVRAAEDEYRRLLYVAMTRAADRLVVAGSRGVQKIPDGCWYQLVENALKPDAIDEKADDGDGVVLRWRKSTAEETVASEPATAKTKGAASLPDWLKRAAPSARKATRTITPSAASGAQPIGDRKALTRGRIVHRLLQALPAIPPNRRAEAARRYLAREAKDFGDAERTALAAEVLAVLSDSRFAPLFAPDSRAEVPIVGRLPAGDVSGQVDRLAVTDTAVLIADYKTNRLPPRSLEDVPADYVTQLALYRAVLAALYPGRAVRAALIWTEGPALMEVPAAALDAALSRVAGAA
jgi:ATP-dependent helicase/nuclease subunit A